MRVLVILLCSFFPVLSFASDFSFNHTQPASFVIASAGLSLHDKYGESVQWQTQYFPGMNYMNKTEFIHIPGMTVFTSEDVKMPGEKKNILDYKGENLIRRAEIIFFGALTFASFAGWLGISGYNMMMGSATFGTLKRYQFMTLFIGSGVVGFAVSLSDILLRVKPYMKSVTLEY